MTKSRKKALHITLAILFLFFFLAIGSAAGLLAGVIRNAPDLDEIRFEPKLTTYIYDINGEVIHRFFDINRSWVPIDQISEYMKMATIAIEDHTFYDHHGLAYRRIVGAFISNLRGGHTQGGSTITQQLAKVSFLTMDRTWTRKMQDAIWALQIERAYTKDEILEAYLNMIYYGHSANGIEAAAQHFFAKSASDLDLAESAMLAAVINSPGLYSPRFERNAERSVNRRNLVLQRMADLGMVTQAEANKAKATPIVLAPVRTDRTVQASYFVEYIYQQLLGRFAEEQIRGGGLKVYTTLDLTMQRAAEEALWNGLPSGYQNNNLTQPQGALISIDPHTGHIKALVGGRGEDVLVRAVQSRRQPGSAIKPFIYVTAIEKGYTAATVRIDEAREFTTRTGEIYAPQNYSRTFSDAPVSLRSALERSLNVYAVQLLQELGFASVIDTIKRMGITSLVESGPQNDVGYAPLALGALTRGVSPLELAAAYGILATGGIYTQPVSILRIEDPNGRVLHEHRTQQKIVLDEKTAFLTTHMLQGVIARGTGTRARIDRPAAGKTGTADDYTNAWFVGYTPELSTAVWIGEDFPRRMQYNGQLVTSGVAAQIWGTFMSNALRGRPIQDFPRPSQGGIVEAVICSESGLLPSSDCPTSSQRTEIFIQGTVPTEVCTLHTPEPLPEPMELQLETRPGSFWDALPDWLRFARPRAETPVEEPPAPSQLPSQLSTPSLAPDLVPQPTTTPTVPAAPPAPAASQTPSTSPSSSGLQIVTVDICIDTQRLATEFCPSDRVVPIRFMAGSEPKQECNIHY